MRRKLGISYWSLSSFIKTRTKKALEYFDNFENAVVHEAKKRDVDGVVCGHIHHPAVKIVDSITYANTGDSVENCSAVVENQSGELQVLYWENQKDLATVKALKPLSADIKAA